MPYFNTTNLSNATDYVELMQYVDQSSGYYLGPLIVMAVWFISFLALGLYMKEEAIAASSVITMIVAALIWAITGSWIGFALALAATLASGLILFLRR